MARRKWYKQILAIMLTAMLILNGSETGLSALADILSVQEQTQTSGEQTDEISGETEDKPAATPTSLKKNNAVDPPEQQSAGGGGQ